MTSDDITTWDNAALFRAYISEVANPARFLSMDGWQEALEAEINRRFPLDVQPQTEEDRNYDD